jgi:hypothetical protein
MAKASWRTDATPRPAQEFRIGVDQETRTIFVDQIDGNVIRTIAVVDKDTSQRLAQEILRAR